MAKRNSILEFVHSYLRVDDFEDYCVNGLQIEGKEDVNKIVSGTSVSLTLFEKAISEKADMIILHHGIFWKGQRDPFFLTGNLKRRVELLIKNDINLAGYHLPLDAHEEIGNNARLCQELGLVLIEPIFVGWLAKSDKALSFEELLDRISKITGSEKPFYLKPHNKTISRIAVVSGSGDSYYMEAKKAGAELLITGGIKESYVREIEEEGLCFISAGHYNSEKLGIQSLGEVISKEFDVEHHYIDVPNPI